MVLRFTFGTVSASESESTPHPASGKETYFNQRQYTRSFEFCGECSTPP
jgi:hypothetical protein